MRGLSHTGIVHQAILWVVGNGRKSRHDAGSPMKMKRKLFSKSLYNLTSRWVHGGRKESSTVPRAFFESGDVASQPQIPLSERPATFVTSFALIKKWYGQAEGKLAEVGNSLAEDGGPLRKELHTELDWLVEDAIGQMKLCSQEDEDVWEPAKWDQIASELCGTDGDNKVGQVKLRISLLQLEDIWQKRLVERAPLQYLTSSAFWRDMVLSVGPGVLIPRPETELIIDYVVEATKSNPSIAVGDWADLGTGSGALAVGIARALPLAPTIWAADVASEPLKYTSFNAKRYNVSDRVRVIRSNWFDGFVEAGVEQLCGIVSNPPYIPNSDLQGLQAEVVNHEPHIALDGGGGLAIDSLVPICRGAATLLQPGGFLALETVGGEQAHYIAHILHHLEKSDHDDTSSGDDRCLFEQIAVRRDLRGVERFVTAIKKNH